MEANLVHSEGDYSGEPFRLAEHERRALYRLYEYRPCRCTRKRLPCRKGWHFVHKKALIGWPKGSGKTEFVAALGLEHLVGPCAGIDPNIPVAATTEDQAGLLLTAAGQMVADTPLEELLDVQQSQITRRQGYGRMYTTAASLGANDGKKPTRLLADEIHEWDAHSGAGKKRHAILNRGLAKRLDSQEINITTAGWSFDTLAGEMYQLGRRLAERQHTDPTFLFDWQEASEHWDLNDELQLLAAIREANPAADVFWDAENLVREYHEHLLRGEVNDFIRYHLNRWIGALEDSWMAADLWNGCKVADLAPPAEGTPVVLGFDGSRYHDSTALVGCTISPRPQLFVLGHWEPDDNHPADWKAPVGEVEDTILAATRRLKVVELAADISYWESSMHKLEQAGITVMEIPQSPKTLGPACTQFYAATANGELAHDGDERLARHIANCRRHETEWGTRIVKEYAHSRRRIDLAVAAVQAHARALHHNREVPPAEAGVIDLADYLVDVDVDDDFYDLEEV